MANYVLAILGASLLIIAFLLLISGTKSLYANQVIFDQTGINIAGTLIIAIAACLLFIAGRKD